MITVALSMLFLLDHGRSFCTGLMDGFDPNIKTLDIDFLLKNLKKPSPPVNLIELAKADNYLVKSDYITGATKILDKRGLEIEFLISKVGAGNEVSLKTNLGVTAQTLRHMNIILRNTLKVDFFDMVVTVPIPEAYLIHKMIINNQRGIKKEKDRLAIINLWNHVNKDRFTDIYNNLTKKEKEAVNAFMSQNSIS